jgi:DNA-binding IclR family transcriptional regulator
VQVVVRSLNVLRALARSSRGLNLAEVAERVDLPVASAHRILAVLESEGFVTRSSTNRRYFLGPASRELGRTSDTRQSPLVTAHHAVADASKATGETVFISEFSGREVVCIALNESTYPLRLFVRVGQVMPLHAAAAARVLLAWRDAEEARKALAQQPLLSYTEETPTSIDAVFQHLQIIRARGFDICESELDENVWAVSAPVRSSTDEVVASVTLAAPEQRVNTEQARNRAIELIVEAAATMSADLGWVAPLSTIA